MSEVAYLALADGSVFEGVALGARGSVFGEVVFNTSMYGYQEILTDPSYSQQIITFTYPHIGNIGVNSDDNESHQPFASGVVVRSITPITSNWRSEESFEHFLVQQNIVGISEVDTRQLTRLLRDKGVLPGVIVSNGASREKAIELAKTAPGMQGQDLAQHVSTPAAYPFTEGLWQQQSPPSKYRVVAYDFGIKRSILRHLVNAGCDVTVVPARTPAADVLAMRPDGVFLSNGPGDPAPCGYAIEHIRSLAAERVPLFGICLGFQLIALAFGAKTIKMKFGHHGGNHPVQCLKTQKVMITSQNHGFCVDESSLPETLIPTYRSLFDDTLQGIAHTTLPVFGFQGHPEAGPGPNDAIPLFQDFVEAMQHHKT